MKATQHEWNENWLKTAAKVLSVGGSMAQIAKAINQSYNVNITKNSVVGKINRAKAAGDERFSKPQKIEFIGGKPISTLLRHWADGVPANEIADNFGIHRNTVYKKAIEYGLNARDSNEALKSIIGKTWKKNNKSKVKKTKFVKQSYKAENKFPNPNARGVNMLDLTHNQCRFVIGDGPYLFCGEKIEPGSSSSYCAICHKVVYTARNS